MRLLLLVFMIALLPVRGWVSDAMAIDMAAQQMRMAQQAPGEPMAEDCPMNAQTSAVPSVDAPVDASQANETASPCNCNACDLCLALASLTFSRVAAVAFVPHAPPPASGTRFSSAERGLNLKPPIS
jgi:hypothetical protein